MSLLPDLLQLRLTYLLGVTITVPAWPPCEHTPPGSALLSLYLSLPLYCDTCSLSLEFQAASHEHVAVL